MSKRIHLDVPEPCHENWNNMTPVEKGRFCNSCQKQVVDFTRMTDAQVAAFFRKPSTSSVCGRFMSDQLNRDIEIPRKRIPWVKYFFQIALPAFLMSAKASAQGTVSVIKKDTVIQPETFKGEVRGKVSPVCIKDQQKTENVIDGKVVDEKGLPLAGATIIIKGTTVGTATDVSGDFHLKYNGEKTNIVLTASYVGFMENEIVIDLAKKISLEPIKLTLAPFLAGEVVVTMGIIIPSKKPPIPLIPVLDDSVDNNLRIFPNPVSRGSSLNIEVKDKVKEGYYLLDLINTGGQYVYRKEMYIDAKAGLLDLQIPLVKPGNYFLRMTDKSSKKNYTEKLVIQ